MTAYVRVWLFLSTPLCRFQCWSVGAAWKYTHSERFTMWVHWVNKMLFIPFRYTNPL